MKNYGFSGILPVLAVLALALSVFGCGGGDDSSTTAPTTPAEPSTGPTEPSSPAAIIRNDIIRNAALNRPVAGSVSQGSRRGQSSQGIDTLDTVRWNGSGGTGITVTVRGATAQFDSDSADSSNILQDVDLPSGITGLVTDPSSDPPYAIAQVVSGISYEATSGTFTPGFSVAPNPDLVFGLWATANAPDDITAIGAFADGTETPSASIPTSGTYRGNLLAFYQNFDGDGDEDQASYSVATVELTVATNGSVSGRVFNIADKDDPDSNSFTFIDEGAGGAIVVALGAAAPDSSEAGGFFNGTTTLSRGGQTVSEGVDSNTGRWGGQFFGTDGGTIAGTIGLNIRYSGGNGSQTVFGSFSATRSNN